MMSSVIILTNILGSSESIMGIPINRAAESDDRLQRVLKTAQCTPPQQKYRTVKQSKVRMAMEKSPTKIVVDVASCFF
jgi:hypothetical protein